MAADCSLDSQVRTRGLHPGQGRSVTWTHLPGGQELSQPRGWILSRVLVCHFRVSAHAKPANR